jgi:hypothetical protein
VRRAPLFHALDDSLLGGHVDGGVFPQLDLPRSAPTIFANPPVGCHEVVAQRDRPAGMMVTATLVLAAGCSGVRAVAQRHEECVSADPHDWTMWNHHVEGSHRQQ